MKPPEFLRRLPAVLAGAGLLLAGSLPFAAPALADDANSSQSATSDDQSASSSGDSAKASSDNNDNDNDQATTPGTAATPRGYKHPKPTYTLPPKLKHPKPKYTLPPKKVQQAPAASQDAADPKAGSTTSSSTTNSSPAQATTGTTATSEQPAAGTATTAPKARKATKLMATEDDGSGTDNGEPPAITPSDANCQAEYATFTYYLPVALDKATTSDYPYDAEQITWAKESVTGGSATFTLQIAGPTALTTTQNAADEGMWAKNLKDGDYTATAYETLTGDSVNPPSGTIYCGTSGLPASSISFTIKKAVPAISAPDSISYNNYNPIPISGTGFRPGKAVTITAIGADGTDTGCSLTVTPGDDGNFQVARAEFSGDCFWEAKGTATITATPSTADDSPASTKVTITDDPYVNPSKLTLDQKKLHVGDTTVLHATGFTPGAKVTFNWSPNSGSYFELGSAVADADGNADFTWEVGDDVDGMPIDTGAGTVVAMDDSGNYATADAAILAEATQPVINVQSPDLTVNPTPVTLTPTPVTVKSPLTTNNYYTYHNDNRHYQTRVLPATVAAGTTTGGSGKTLPYTGTNVLSTGILALTLMGAGAVALIARRRMSMPVA